MRLIRQVCSRSNEGVRYKHFCSIFACEELLTQEAPDVTCGKMAAMSVREKERLCVCPHMIFRVNESHSFNHAHCRIWLRVRAHVLVLQDVMLLLHAWVRLV